MAETSALFSLFAWLLEGFALTACKKKMLFQVSTLKGLFIWAQSTGLAPFPRSRLAILFFVRISMCSYERLGWPWAGPVTEISVFAANISVTKMKIFPYEHSSPVTRTKLFKQNSVALTTYRPKWHNFGPVCISSLGVCELALLVKLQDSTKLWQSLTIQVCVPPFCLFLEFTSVDRAEISHMNTPQNSSQ